MRFVIALLLPAFVVRPSAAEGQSTEAADAHLRNDCRLAAQVLRTGHPAPQLEWALSTIDRCQDTGPAIVAEIWGAAAPPIVERAPRLAGATRRFSDRAVVEAVMDVAGSPEYPDSYRVQAIALLYSYARPGLYVYAEDLTLPRDQPARVYTRSGDSYVHAAAETLGNFSPELAVLLQSIILLDPDGPPGRSAARILALLASSPG